MGPPSYMRSVVDRNVVMRRIAVLMLPSWYAGRHSETLRSLVRFSADKKFGTKYSI